MCIEHVLPTDTLRTLEERNCEANTICLILAALLTGCATISTPTPVASIPTQAPTWTPQPTFTPNPTYTPFPKPTVLPATATPQPTSTPAPDGHGHARHLCRQAWAICSLRSRCSLACAVETLAAANNLQDLNHIEVGSTLVIPLTPTVGLSVTAFITVTPKAVVALPVAVVPPAPKPAPTNFVYPMPKIQYPANGATLKYDAKGKDGSDSVIFSWLPVGQLLGVEDKQSCSWEGQPNGTTGYLWDRYHIEFDRPLRNDKLGKVVQRLSQRPRIEPRVQLARVRTQCELRLASGRGPLV